MKKVREEGMGMGRRKIKILESQAGGKALRAR